MLHQKLVVIRNKNWYRKTRYYENVCIGNKTVSQASLLDYCQYTEPYNNDKNKHTVLSSGTTTTSKRQ
jgi:hypothetical protein